MIRASAETCYECLRGENKQKLEVLSFEKAWDKIEKDIYKCCNVLMFWGLSELGGLGGLGPAD